MYFVTSKKNCFDTQLEFSLVTAFDNFYFIDDKINISLQKFHTGKYFGFTYSGIDQVDYLINHASISFTSRSLKQYSIILNNGYEIHASYYYSI